MIRRARRSTVVTVLAVLASTLLSACQEPPPPMDPDAEVPFYPPANRPDVRGTHGAVSAAHPLAAQAGLRVLQEGGNAVDAAVAMAAVLAVVRPHMNGVGGDAFVLVYEAATGEVHALNGSGRAGALATPGFFRDQGLEEVPSTGPLSVSVPGAVAAWVDVHERFGSRPFAELLAPAITYARDGFPVSTRLASDLESQSRALNEAGKALYLPRNGQAPEVGSLLKNPALAATLERIASRGKAGFYQGSVAETLGAFLEAQGSHLRVSDFAAHTSTWDAPISTVYRGLRVWECPPNGQGLTALIALNILEGFDLAALDPLGPERLHLIIESLRAAFADTRWHVADPAFNPVPLEGLLSKSYAAQRRALINRARATLDTRHGSPVAGSDTVYFCVVDGQGNACSFINSNYMGFGTGIVPPGTGFSLQNRGHNFSLDPAHPNALAPGKRPYHTIIPGMLTRDAGAIDQSPLHELIGPFGVMGGFMQPQGHVQVVVDLVDDGLDPQAALNRLRLCLEPGRPDGRVALEDGLPPDTASRLAAMGHDVFTLGGYERAAFGRGQIIRREPDGVLWGGSDPRADGCAMGF